MTSKSEDDALAEQKIQMSLQCTANDLTGSHDLCGNQDEAQLEFEGDNLVEDAPTHASATKTQSPSTVAFPCFSKPCERSKPSELADIEQPATSDFYERQMLLSADSHALQDIGGLAAHSPTSGIAIETGEAQQEERNGTRDSQLGSDQLDVDIDPDVSMKGAGTLAAGAPQRPHQSAIAIAPAPLNKPTTAASTSVLVNPWTNFASVVNAISFAADTTSSTFRPKNGCPSTAISPGERREQTNDQSSALHLLNEYVAGGHGHSSNSSFRFRGPFVNRTTARGLATKKAVMYVLDGPYSFKKAAPALEEFCRNTGLALPDYRHHREREDCHTCNVRVGGTSNIFGDFEENYANVQDATEDAAKKAMNALHRQGRLPSARITTSDPSTRLDLAKKVEYQPKSRPPSGSTAKNEALVFTPDAAVKKSARGPVQNCESLRCRGQLGATNVAAANPHIAAQWVALNPSASSEKPAPRTRAGLARLLKSICEPHERVYTICEYLLIPKPRFLVEQLPGATRWSARFPPPSPLAEEVVHAVLSFATINDEDWGQDCARLVEQKFFEKIYSGEIHLEDGDARFVDPAAHTDRRPQYFANLRPTCRRLLEADEGLTLEEIGRRVDGSDTLLLPPSANGLPLGVARKPLAHDCGLGRDTGYASEDEVGPDAMILANTRERTIRRARHGDSGTHPSQEMMPCMAGETIESDGQANLLPLSKHRSVSPRPFLDTPSRQCPNVEPEQQLKLEPVSDPSGGAEVIFVGERKVERGLLS